MNIAVIGYPPLPIKKLEKFLPDVITSIVWSGNYYLYTSIKNLAKKKQAEFDYCADYIFISKLQSLEQLKNLDLVVILWDKRSQKTKFIIDVCRRLGLYVNVVTYRYNISRRK